LLPLLNERSCEYDLGPDDSEIEELKNILSPFVNDFSPDDEIGWEEYTAGCLCYALRQRKGFSTEAFGKTHNSAIDERN
jgi:hypothetical protein